MSKLHHPTVCLETQKRWLKDHEFNFLVTTCCDHSHHVPLWAKGTSLSDYTMRRCDKCGSKVELILGTKMEKETKFDVEKYGFVLYKKSNESGIETYRHKNAQYGELYLMVSCDVFTLYLIQNERESTIASRYNIETEAQLEFLLKNGRVGYIFK